MNGGNKAFTDLKIWRDGYELVLEIGDMVDSFPDFQKFGLVVQLHKSANSIIANIAESQGRYYYLDKIRVLYISRGELIETRSHLKVAFGLGYTTEKKYNEIDGKYESLHVSLNNYINYLLERSKEMPPEKGDEIN